MGFDATTLYSREPQRVLDDRLDVKAICGRYGRADPHSWEDRDVNEMNRYFHAVIRLVQREGAGTEDR